MSFTLNADAPAFTPSAACLAAIAAAAAPAPAAARPTPLTVMLDREVSLFPMKAPRTESLQDDVLDYIGTRVLGTSNYWEENILDAHTPSPFACDQPELDAYGEDAKVHTMGCHNNDYRLASCLRSMPGSADPTPEQLGDFPKNIQHYYWISEGKNDEHPWRTLCRLTTGLFVFLEASCNFSGFECQGNIHVYGAEKIQTLIDNAMSDDARRRFGRIFSGPSKSAAGGAKGSLPPAQKPAAAAAGAGGGTSVKPAAAAGAGGARYAKGPSGPGFRKTPSKM